MRSLRRSGYDASGYPIFTPNCTQTMVQVGGDVQVKSVVNPCTGDPGILTVTPSRSVYHLNVDGAGDAWDTGTMQGSATFTPTDASAPSGAGPFSQWFGDSMNAQNAESGFTLNIVLHMSNGQMVLAHILTHVTFSPNSPDPVVNMSVKSVACR